jgi:very-short-patch-repair endonuclease
MPKKLSKKEILKKFQEKHNNFYDYSKMIIKNINTKIIIICPIHGEFLQTPKKHMYGQGCPKCKNKNKSIFDIKNEMNIIHNNFYDYSLFLNYVNNTQKINIICPIHGIFIQSVAKHKRGQGCSKCSNVYKYSTTEFIDVANKIQNNRYSYTKTDYKNNKTKIVITCPIHGDFEQTPGNHLKGQGCPKCSGNIKKQTDEFILVSNKIHNNFYDYSKTQYIDSKTKVIITCPIHGDFEQNPNSHIKGHKCSKCVGNNKKNNDEFIILANKIHDNFYSYDKIIYKGNKNSIIITCPIHGDFVQLPSNHLKGHGCPKCNNKIRDIDNFKKYSNELHNNFYSYDKSLYKDSRTKLIITCPIHGDFKQNPNHHLRGQGCPRCNASKGETKIQNYLDLNNIDYDRQKSFDECKYIKKLQFDFYVQKYNLCIEYDGIQHYKPIEFFGGIKSFEQNQIKDKIKTDYCKNNNIKLLRISYQENIQDILDNFFY